jgi:hypothetical protein
MEKRSFISVALGVFVGLSLFAVLSALLAGVVYVGYRIFVVGY